MNSPLQRLKFALRDSTPARVGLHSTGVSLTTDEVLRFQLAHARARDAVYSRLQMSSLMQALEQASGRSDLALRSQAADREAFLRNPALGRQLHAASRQKLLAETETREAPDLVLVVADGLSALAAERHAPPLLSTLLPLLPGWKIAPILVVEQGRVAIGDAIGQLLRASLAVVLLGERPGLSSPDSLGAYLTWQPRAGRTDAERNCLSNIRPEGLDPALAARRLGAYLYAARQLQKTGVSLKEPEMSSEIPSETESREG